MTTMKTCFLLGLFWLIALTGQAQSNPAKIYIVKNGTPTFGSVTLYTTIDPNQAIKMTGNVYVLLETNADSLGLIKGAISTDKETITSDKKQKPAFIKLEKGKSYYFKIGTIRYTPFLDVEEMTERAFHLYLGLNDFDPVPQKFVLNTSRNTAKKTQ